MQRQLFHFGPGQRKLTACKITKLEFDCGSVNTPVFPGRKSTNTVLCALIAANLTTLHAQSVTICCKEEAGEDVSRDMDPKQITHIIPNPEMDPGRK